MSIGAAPVYTNIQGLSALRAEARSTPSEAVEEVASQFESLFVHMMLKSMRDATVEGGLFDSNQLDLYQQMFDQQVSLDIAQQGGIGLAETLVTQLNGNQASAKSEAIVDLQAEASSEKITPMVSFDSTSVDIKRQMLGLFSDEKKSVEVASDTALASRAKDSSSARVGGPDSELSSVALESEKARWLPESPEAFIRHVWDHAVEAAKDLGLDPAVLVAQSALETGWGKKVIQAGKDSSFNLFGIKAGDSWSGDAAAVKTLEFRDGLAVLETASFRVYDSLAGSFSDYVDFLKGNPRYQQALENVGDKKDFLAELQNAGYATDPQYAEKILGILDGGNYSSVINELKNSQQLPLSG